MKNALKLGLAGVGAWLLYTWAKGQGFLEPASAATTAAATSPAAAAAATPTLLQLMTARAAQDPIWQPTMSPHEWNFLYQLIRGGTPPAPPDGLPDKLSMQEWYTAMQPLGVAGMGYVWRS